MGSNPELDEYAEGDEQSQHRLDLPAYYIAETPITNAQYAAFVRANSHRQPLHWQDGNTPPGKDDHPVTNVGQRDAVAYCEWLSSTTSSTYRVPSEAEWEKAARGTDGFIWPRGNRWDVGRCNSVESGIGDTTPVGAYTQLEKRTVL